MAYDKAVDSQALDRALGAVADAIRGKTGRTEPMTLEQMPGEINGIQTGVELPELSNPGSAEDLMEGKELLGPGGLPVVGTFTLDDELAAQGELIEQLNAALVGKAWGEGSGIPPGWWRCDYIWFTGKQLVDTGMIGTQDTRIHAAFTRENSAQRYLLGCAHKENTAALTLYTGGTARFGNKYATKLVGTVSPYVGHFLLMDKTTISTTGSVSSISDVNDFETIGTVLLGGCRNSDGSLPTTMYDGKVPFLAWEQSDELALKLIPVTNGTAFAFWDSVGRKFHNSITDTPLSGGYW